MTVAAIIKMLQEVDPDMTVTVLDPDLLDYNKGAIRFLKDATSLAFRMVAPTQTGGYRVTAIKTSKDQKVLIIQ